MSINPDAELWRQAREDPRVGALLLQTEASKLTCVATNINKTRTLRIVGVGRNRLPSCSVRSFAIAAGGIDLRTAAHILTDWLSELSKYGDDDQALGIL